jgi:hypothetical protein
LVLILVSHKKLALINHLGYKARIRNSRQLGILPLWYSHGTALGQATTSAGALRKVKTGSGSSLNDRADIVSYSVGKGGNTHLEVMNNAAFSIDHYTR